MSEQLKPCPFCGGEAFVNFDELGGTNLAHVMCSECWVSGPERDDGTEQLAWNTRTDLSQALVAAKLREAANARPPQYAIYGNDRTDAYAKGFCGGVETFRDAILALIDTDHQAALDAVRAEERERIFPSEMADALIAHDAHKLNLMSDEDMPGWVSGLSMDGNCVAHLDYEDSQYGPSLWDFALTVLKQYAAFRGAK